MQFEDFINRMKKYNDKINIGMLFNIFGNKIIDMVKGTYEGIFKETYYEIDKVELGEFVKKCLGSRKEKNKALVKYPEKLYTSLSKIQNVNEIIKGNIPSENVSKILYEIKQRNVNIPKELYELDKFYAKIERKCSPEFLVAGDASVCCMSFGNSNARTYALEKGFSIFNVYYKNRIIANSVLWINKAYNCLVLDNIEVHPNYKKFNKFITKLYNKMIEDIMKKYNIDFTVQGADYNDLKLYDLNSKKVYMEEFKPVAVKNRNFYSDAEYVYLVSVNKEKISKKNAYKILQSKNDENIDGFTKFELAG